MKKLAHFVTTHYKFVLLSWAIFLGVMGFFAIKLPGLLEGDGFKMDGEHEAVMKIASETFDLPAETLFVVFDEVEESTIEKTLSKIEQLDITSAIVSPLEERKQYTAQLSYALLHFDSQVPSMPDAVDKINDAIGKQEGVTLTGMHAIAKDINTASQKDLMTAEAIGLPIAIIILLLAFGTVVASAVPLLIGLSTVVSAFGILAILGANQDLSIFILNIVPMLGLALSIDFALLFISRYKEEMKKRAIKEAIEITVRTAGRSVIFSAFCVFIGLGSMLLIDVDIFQNIAVGGMIVVGMAVISSITLLPAVLTALDTKILKGRIIKEKPHATNHWRSFANKVIKRPVTITILAFVLLGIAVIPVKNMDLTIPQMDALPIKYDTRSSYEKVDDEFGLMQDSSIYLIAERSEGWTDHDGLQAMFSIQEALAADSLVKEYSTIFSLGQIDTVEQWEQMIQVPQAAEELKKLEATFVQDNQLLIPITISAENATEEAQQWARDWSNKFNEYDVMIGGMPKFNQEIFDEISDKIVSVLLVIIVSTFIILMLAFRSILIPIKAILMNIVGLSATFGILVYIFQYGHFGLQAGTIALIIPVIVFSLVFGLSMDYEVFLISRMQEEYAKTHDNDHSTVEGLATTSKVITSAALIMIVLTGAFAFTDVMPVKQIGVGIAIAVAIDATIIRLLLVPSLMKLFGDWNWWMPFKKGKYTIKSFED